MSNIWTDVAGDGLANNDRIYSHPVGRIETGPRENYKDVTTLVTATTYFERIFLEKGTPVGNIGCYVCVAAATPTSSWAGIWTHPTNAPHTRLLNAGQGGPGTWGATNFVSQWTFTRTAGSATMTVGNTGIYVPGNLPMSLVGREATSTGVPAGRWIRSQTLTTITLNDGTSVTAGTNVVTVKDFYSLTVAGKYNIGYTTNGATGAVPAGQYTRPLTTGIVVPASGVYMLSWTFAATTMPQLASSNHSATQPTGFLNDAPAASQTHVNGTTNNTAPGTNPVISGSAGTAADSRNRIYMFVTA